MSQRVMVQASKFAMAAPQSVSPQRRRPDAWLAVNYSLVFPGGGQLYSRHWGKGGAIVAISLGLLGYATWSIFGAAGDTVAGLVAIAGFVVLYSFSILDAYRGTQTHYASRIAVPRHRDPWYGVFLSQLLPGLGHLYIQQAVVGGMLLILGIVTAFLANSLTLLVPFPPAIWAISCYLVYVAFPHRGRRASGAIALLVLGLFLSRLILGLAPGWIDAAFEQCFVPSDSMAPVLQVGDRLFVRQTGPYTPRAGDIAVFTPPPAALLISDPHSRYALYVKRIIAVPGQTVEIVDGVTVIDGQPQSEPYAQQSPESQWGPETVPPGSVFVLGDNRSASSDSRLWGYVPMENFLGAAYKIYWPPARVRSLQ